MVSISEEDFSQLIDEVMAELPDAYIENMNNVAVVVADEPTASQRQQLQLRCHETLFGLYEGIPLTKRGAGYALVLPDKITIFRLPIMEYAKDYKELREQTKRTLWHEIAHHYGIDHDRIHQLESRKRKNGTKTE